ncbi:MAG: phytoene desaturase family protein [Candidatus Xenobiia bacterium LiM19]
MKKIIIIGAGIAGLTAGIYARLNGFDTELYEMHEKPGGECTGWNRGRYHFDGCLHWLMGSKPGTSLNSIWRETGALDDSVTIANHDIFARYEMDGRTLDIHTDVNKLEKNMIELSPKDEKEIRKFCSDVRAFGTMTIPLEKPFDMIDMKTGMKYAFKHMPQMAKMKKYEKINADKFLSKFKDPLIKMAFREMMSLSSRASWLLMTLASLNDGDSGFPLGGSLAFAKRMEKRFLDLGGKAFYKAKVDKIIVNDGKVQGIRLCDGSLRNADFIISAADGYATLYDMLDNRHTPECFRELFSDNEKYPTTKSSLVMLGVKCSFRDRPRSIVWKLDRPLDGGGVMNETLNFTHYCYDPSMAPEGKSVMNCCISSGFDHWNELYRDKEKYRAEKKRLLDDVCAAVISRFPELEGMVETTDVATPMTYVRYCNAWRGSWMSWSPGEKVSSYQSGILPGLDGFIMAGQWTMPPGGLPGAGMAGRFAVQRLCIREGIEFKTK